MYERRINIKKKGRKKEKIKTKIPYGLACSITQQGSLLADDYSVCQGDIKVASTPL